MIKTFEIDAIAGACIPNGKFKLTLSEQQIQDFKTAIGITTQDDIDYNEKATYFLAMNGFVGTREACDVLWEADHG